MDRPGLVWLAPIVGAALYACFGVNRIQRKAVSLRVGKRWQHAREVSLDSAEVQARDQLAEEYPNLVGLATLVRRLAGTIATPGNQVQTLLNGDEAYPAMIRAIQKATSSVSLLSYIFDSDRVGDVFYDALVDARRRGLEVRVLIDGVGVRYSRVDMVQRLQSTGVTAATFLPTRVPRMFRYANLRNHRKIMVVDGRIAFTGGTNIREGHALELSPAAPVRCVHFRLEGPIAAQLQEAFAIDWAFATGESLGGPAWFPPLDRGGTVWARGIPDGPDEDFEKLTETMIGALSISHQTVSIVTPYFLPESPLIRALSVTALRGVDLRIYLPEKNNIPFVTWASAAVWDQLLEKGCRIFLTPSPFDHTKLMVVDQVWSLIGSTNWDPRSLRLNFEYNVECYDKELAEDLSRLIHDKAEYAREVTLGDVRARSFPIRLRDGVARLLTPYL
jgi:cardiolipin synthase